MTDDPQTSVPASGSSAPTQAAFETKPSFGIVDVLKESFSAYSRRFIIITVVVFIANLLTYLSELTNPQEPFGGNAEFAPVAFVLAATASFIAYFLSTAFVVQIAFDARMGQPTSSVAVFKKVVRQAIPLVIMSILATLLVGLGFVALIVPGIYLLGVLAVYVPAIVVERSGFRAFKRSAELTKGYRWPIIGTLLVVYLMVVAVSALVFGLVTQLVGSIGIAPMMFIAAILEVIPYALLSVVTAMMYARLLEIKEGVSVDDIAKVFA